MLDGNTAALNAYLRAQDEAEARFPGDELVKSEQDDIFWSRLHDIEYITEALDTSEMNETQLDLCDQMCRQAAYGEHLTAGQLLTQLLHSRLYPSYEEAEAKLTNDAKDI